MAPRVEHLVDRHEHRLLIAATVAVIFGHDDRRLTTAHNRTRPAIAAALSMHGQSANRGPGEAS